jgi:hypothetical protein
MKHVDRSFRAKRSIADRKRVRYRRMTMLRKAIFLVCAAALAVLGTSSKVQAWGCAHVGYTHVGPYGVQHVSGTRAYGGGYRYGGAYGGYHYGAVGGYGGYRYGTVGGYGAAYGGYHYGGYGGARAGYVRTW